MSYDLLSWSLRLLIHTSIFQKVRRHSAKNTELKSTLVVTSSLPLYYIYNFFLGQQYLETILKGDFFKISKQKILMPFTSFLYF